MVNSVSFTSGFRPQYSTTAIAPTNDRYVTINGERHKVVKVPCHDVCSFAPQYRDVVIVDGKQYPVKQVPNIMGCDMTKDVVVVDGQEYDVTGENTLSDLLSKLGNVFTANQNSSDSKVSYMA